MVNGKLENAIIKIGGVQDGKTNSDGQFYLTKEYKVGTKLSLEVSLASYNTFSKEIEVQDNNGKDNEVNVKLTASGIQTTQKRSVRC